MLQITVPSNELYDDSNGIFIYTKEQTITLEHSLVSISKWESKWNTPFLSNKPKTVEQELDYIKFMTITKNVDPIIYLLLTDENKKEIKEYINAPMTATTFVKDNSRGNNRIMTSEIIYYWMISLGIPFECQKWHLNRLLTLIRVCNEENKPKKKMNSRDLGAQYSRLNAERRKRLNSKG